MKINGQLPKQANVVIIGGGIIGCSIAYHLGHMGCRDVVLLERDELTSGTTWHAAGLMVTFGSLSQTSTEMRLYGRDLYNRLEAETGLATGFTPVGFIEVASDKDRLEEYRRVAAFNRYCGIDVHEISPQEVKALFPLARVDDLLAGFYVKEDGRVNPVDATLALAKGARNQGVQIIQGVAVTGIIKNDGCGGRGQNAFRGYPGRGRRQLCRHVGTPAGRGVRCQYSQSGRRALLSDHRRDGRHACQYARAGRPVSLRLLS
jgi:glycine/D-amino acid oxidase-like deaminating enzyme